MCDILKGNICSHETVGHVDYQTLGLLIKELSTNQLITSNEAIQERDSSIKGRENTVTEIGIFSKIYWTVFIYHGYYVYFSLAENEIH